VVLSGLDMQPAILACILFEGNEITPGILSLALQAALQ
jgi:hypothetical protein